jgi:hypothetical protein
MWISLVRVLSWLSLGYVVNDATRTIGQVSSTGEYYEPLAPDAIANVSSISIWSKIATFVSIIGGVILIYQYISKKKK